MRASLLPARQFQGGAHIACGTMRNNNTPSARQWAAGRTAARLASIYTCHSADLIQIAGALKMPLKGGFPASPWQTTARPTAAQRSNSLSGAAGFCFLDPAPQGIPRDRHAPNVPIRPAADPAQWCCAARLRAGGGNLRHAQRCALQRRVDLPCAQRLAPRGRAACRCQRPAPATQRRLVGQPHWPWQTAGHQPLFRHWGQQPRFLLRLDRPHPHQPGHRPALGGGFSGGHR